MAGDKMKRVGLEFAVDGVASTKKSLGEVNASLSQNRAEYKQAKSEWDKSTSSVQKLTDANKYLSKQYDESKNKVEILTKELDELENAEVRDEKAISKKKAALATATTSMNHYKDGLDETNAKLKSGSAQIEEYAKKLEDVGQKATEVGKTMTTHVTAPILATGAASLAAWTTIDDAYDNIIVKTGATGDAIDDLTNSFDTVFGSMPVDAEEASEAIGEVNTQFGLTGDSLEELSSYMLKYASINNTDVAQSTIYAKQAMEAYNLTIDDVPSVMDSITYASQATGVSVDELSQKVVEGAPQIKALGLSAEEGAMLIGKLEQSGVDSSAALSSMSKASVAFAKDGKTLDEGLAELQEKIKNSTDETEALNLAAEVFGTKGAVRMVDAIQRGTLDLTELGDTAEIAAGKVEQTFDDTLDPLDQSKVAMNNLTLAGAALGDTIQTALGPIFQKLSEILQGVTTWFKGLDGNVKTIIVVVGGLVAAIGPLLVVFGTMAGSISKIMMLYAGFTSSSAAATAATGGLGATAAATTAPVTGLGVAVKGVTSPVAGLSTAFSGLAIPLIAIIAIIALVVAALVQLWNTNEDFRESVEAAIASIKEVFQALWDTVLAPILAIIKNTLLDVWENGIQPLWNKWVEFVGTITTLMLDFWVQIQPIVMWFIETFGPILVQIFDTVATTVGTFVNGTLAQFGIWLDTIGTVVSGVIETVTGIIDFITGVFTGDWKKAWEGVKSIFSGIWNTLSGIVSGVWNTILGLFTNGGQIFSGVVDGIAEVFKDIVNILVGGINNVIAWPFDRVNDILNGIKEFSILGQEPFFGLWGYNPLPVPQIPKLLAKGGELLNGMAIVGEAGPELLTQSGSRTTVAPLSRGGGATPANIVDYDKMAAAMIRALNHLSIRLDDEEVGKFVDDRLLGVFE